MANGDILKLDDTQGNPRPGLGTVVTVPIANGGTGQATAGAAFDALSPLTTRGDIIYRNATNNVRLGPGTSGQVLTSGGAGADPSWTSVATSGWTTLSCTADQAVINSNVLVSSLYMTFSMVLSTKYRIRGKIFWDTTAAGDFKYGFAQPAAITLIRSRLTTGAAGSTPAWAAIATSITTSAALTGTGTTGGYTFFDFIVHNGANTAAFVFRFAQNTAQNDTGAIVRAGSYMEYAVA